MSSSFPPEILDLIADHLYNEPTTLRACCLVSKSWVPRARRHLFNHVSFHQSGGPSFESWMKAFQDPTNSPAHYTRSLELDRPKVNAVTVSDARPWVHSFNCVVNLRVMTFDADDHSISFTQLHGLSPALKSLQFFYFFAPLPEVLDFICSFPLLEDLSLYSSRLLDQENACWWDAPSTLPKFTGSLFLSDNDRRVTRGLLDLPGGLRFSKISVSCPFGDGDLVKELVSTCSNTMESLRIDLYPNAHVPGAPPLLDLSEATKLKDVEFRLCEPEVGWINTALHTATSENLRQITICFPDVRFPDFVLNLVDERTRSEWQDLDHLLVQLWTTRSIRSVFTYEKMERGIGSGISVSKLLPELTSRGFFDEV